MGERAILEVDIARWDGKRISDARVGSTRWSG